jgi:hypothetical protein
MKIYLNEISGKMNRNPSKIVLIPVCISRDIVPLLEWSRKFVASKTDLIVIFHLRGSLENDFESLKAYGIDCLIDVSSFVKEYTSISRDLLKLASKQFEEEGYQTITISLVRDHEGEIEWMFNTLGTSCPCVAVVSQAMIRHPSTSMLFHPFVDHVFVAEN